MLELKVDFPDALIDIDRKISLTGAPAQTEVVISTKTERAGHIWRSQITVQTDAQGQVALDQVAPLQGSYQSACGMGLIYSQQAENAAATDLFPASVHHALHTEITANCADASAETVLTQRLTNASVQRVEIIEHGIKGVLFVPETTTAQPAVVVLKTKANQPLDESQAALYAARGYAALALDYEHTPALLSSADQLAYFEQSLIWLREKISPKNNFVAVSGYEEGAELAIMLGVAFKDQVSAVVACAPAAEVQSDYPLAVEDIQGPLLLGSGKDHMGSAYQASIAARLQQYGFDYNFQWYDFDGVAAGLRFPHVPTTPYAKTTDQLLTLAKANKSLWFSIIALLHQAVAEAAAPKQLHA